jgi:ankyrin repeat protein
MFFLKERYIGVDPEKAVLTMNELLTFARSGHKFDVNSMRLSKKCDPMPDFSGLLCYAVEHNKVGWVDLLVTHTNCNLDISWYQYSSIEVKSLLHHAIKFSNFTIIKLLLTRCKKLNVTNSNGLTPLALAVTLERLDIVGALIQAGADVNIVGSSCPILLSIPGEMTRVLLDITLLHNAATIGNLEIIKLLLNHGANIDAASRSVPLTALSDSSFSSKVYSFTPLDVAEYYGHDDVARFLREWAPQPLPCTEQVMPSETQEAESTLQYYDNQSCCQIM